jgi:putative ABC transport system ATP-binding protein
VALDRGLDRREDGRRLMLELRDIRVVHNRGTATEVVAIDHIDVRFDAGEFVTVVGTNGAGKSSMVQVISGAQKPSSGRVVLAGRDVTRWPDYRRAGRVARVFDNPQVGTLPDLTIADNMALALARGRRRRLRVAQSSAARRLMRERLGELGLGLERRLDDPVSLLSAGQRQSLTMVMAGLGDPQVLLLDEHLAALDPGTQARVLGLTRQLVAEVGATTLMVTHNMEHAIQLGDRLLVMSRGRVIADLRGPQKRDLTVDELIGHVTAAGDALSDRQALSEVR